MAPAGTGALFTALLPFCLCALALLATENRQNSAIKIQILIALVALFGSCMVAHGELARLKPHSKLLTHYYLWISIGGALGGFLVSIAAPLLFNADYELLVGIALLLILVLELHTREIKAAWRRVAWTAAMGATLMVNLLVAGQRVVAQREAVHMQRNFYGIVQVIEDGQGKDTLRTLVHGAIDHGAQFVHPEKRRNPTTYFSETSGVGRAILHQAKQGPLRIGVVGLGVATLAAYGRPGDHFRFYEINPQVVDLAQRDFTFLKDCPARWEIISGDARLSMAAEIPQAYDILVLNAFTGDSVPVHLLTVEALQIYLRHLKPEGLLCFHLSNRFLDLPPVVSAAARSLGLEAQLVHDPGELARLAAPSNWLMVARREAPYTFQWLKGLDLTKALPDRVPWTDDRSDVARLLF